MSPDILEYLLRILSPTGVLHHPEAMRPYLQEQRGLYHSTAQAVLRPATTLEMAETVKLLASKNIPMVPQGGNTGLCGGAVATSPAVIISTERLRKIRDIDLINNMITVEAGCILSNLQDAASKQGRFFPLSLAAEGSCCIGGILSTNAGGLNVLHYGTARRLAMGLEVVLPSGEIWHGLTRLHKDNTGYDLKQLFIGAEGTLGIITAAVLKLFPPIRSRETFLIGLDCVASGLEILTRARLVSGDNIIACELMNRTSVEMALCHGKQDYPFPPIPPWTILLEAGSSAEFDLSTPLQSMLAQSIEDGLADNIILAQSESQRQDLWKLRESIPEAQKNAGGSIKHDISVPISCIPEFLAKASHAIMQEITGVKIVAFGHVGDGNIHFNLSQPETMETQDFLDLWDSTNHIIHDITTDLKGSISAEHGIGCLKREELARVKTPIEMTMMRQIKKSFDPQNLMNPGKILIL